MNLKIKSMKKLVLTLVFMAASSVFCQNLEIYNWNGSHQDFLPAYEIKKDFYGNVFINDYMSLEPLYEIRKSYGNTYDVYKYENFLPQTTPIITIERKENNLGIINFGF
jgi:hypothetical protein